MNRNEITVTQLTRYIKTLLESDELLRQIVVTGEISNFTHHSSGHLYFTLKDANSKVSAVMFARNAYTLKFVPKDGDKVKVYASLSLYEKSGQYQLLVVRMEKSGLGDLYEEYARRLEVLRENGYMDEDHKMPIPWMPSRIALVTRPTGAAVQDMISTITRRCPMTKILVCPVKVQGEDAKYEISRMIDYLNIHNDRLGIDLIITGRGGGSIEDLWAFNEIEVIEAVYNSSIPIISAVGHEVDFTICDFVADKRALTPTGAGEMAVPDVRDIKDRIDSLSRSIRSSIELKLTNKKERIGRLTDSMTGFTRSIDSKRLELVNLERQLSESMNNRIRFSKQTIESYSKLLDTMSYKKVLKRGYVAVMKDDKFIDSVDLKENSDIRLVTETKIFNAHIDTEVK